MFRGFRTLSFTLHILLTLPKDVKLYYNFVRLDKNCSYGEWEDERVFVKIRATLRSEINKILKAKAYEFDRRHRSVHLEASWSISLPTVRFG